MFPGFYMNSKYFSDTSRTLVVAGVPLNRIAGNEFICKLFFSILFLITWFKDLSIPGGIGKQESEQNKISKKWKYFRFLNIVEPRSLTIFMMSYLVCKCRYAITVCALIFTFLKTASGNSEAASGKLSL